MSFSFRSLYTDDGHQVQAGSSPLLRGETQHRLPQPTTLAKPARPVMPAITTGSNGIPGPLTRQTSHIPVSITAADCNQKDTIDPSSTATVKQAFYSLDALEPQAGDVDIPNTPDLSKSDSIDSGKISPANSTTATPSTNPAIKSLEFAASPISHTPSLASVEQGDHEAQIKLRAVFSVVDKFTLERIAVLTAKLPGIISCLILNSDGALLASAEPESVHPVAIAGFPGIESFRPVSHLLGLDNIDGISLRSGTGSISCFSCSGLSLIAQHDGETLAVGLWEKLILITQAATQLRSLT